jgi:hypothetical protein
MWGLVLAAALTFGLIEVAAARPDRRENREQRRLVFLAGKRASELTLDEAADGVVLSQKFKQPALEKYFRAEATKKQKAAHVTVHDARR